MIIRLCRLRVLLLLTIASNSLFANMSLEFDDVSTFRDFTINGLFNEEAARDLFVKQFQMLWADGLDQELPENVSIELTFHDIDLAGDMHPIPRFGQSHSRVISKAFPPMLNFSYRLLDPDENVLAKGDASLLGKDYQFRYRGAAPVGSQTFYYEFEMLSRWLQTLPEARGGGLANKS